MSFVKLAFGFLVGLLACGFLLFLISVRTPVQDTEPAVTSVEQEAETDATAEDAPASDDAQESETAPSEDSGSAAPSNGDTQTGDADTATEQPSEIVVTDLSGDAAQKKTLESEPEATVEADATAPASTEVAGEDTAPEVVEEAPETTEETETVVEEAPAVEPEPDTTPETSQTETAEAADASEDAATEEAQTEEAVTEEAPKATEDAQEETEVAVVRPSSRLPTIGSGGNSRIRLSSEEPEVGTQETFGAFELNAQNFAGRDLPVISIIFVDIGNDGVSRSELLGLQAVATFAVSAGQSGAERAAADYHDAGHEVLVLPHTEAALTTARGGEADIVREYVASLPEALGLVDVPAATLQKDRGAVANVITALSETGHALLTYDRGLNSTDREAAKLGVPSAKIFRVLDLNKERAPAIERHLDRAVLEANQEGAAIVLGSTSPQTFDAVRGWLASSAASDVDVAPVSVAISRLRE